MVDELCKYCSVADITALFGAGSAAGFASPPGGAFYRGCRCVSYRLRSGSVVGFGHYATTPRLLITSLVPHRVFQTDSADIYLESIYFWCLTRPSIKNHCFQTHILTLNPKAPHDPATSGRKTYAASALKQVRVGGPL